MTITESAPLRRCAEKDCNTPAMPRKGTRGPYPKRCAEHTEARKKQINHHPVKPKEARYECCDADHLCPQHKDQRNELREQAGKEMARESAFQIFGMLDAELENAGIQIVIPGENPKYWGTHYGPWEGRTSKNTRNPDPKSDSDARAFYKANPGWSKAANRARGPWPSRWSSCFPPSVFMALFCAALKGEKFTETYGRNNHELAC
jgi:hypothetical protein